MTTFFFGGGRGKGKYNESLTASEGTKISNLPQMAEFGKGEGGESTRCIVSSQCLYSHLQL